MKLLSPVTESTIHTTRIDGLTTIHTVLWKHFQHHFSINMWCGMIDDMLIGPVILDDHMTGHNYLDFLQNGLPEQVEDVPLAAQIAMYFQHDQHDGAPSHYT
jgi:hypothetical protein